MVQETNVLGSELHRDISSSVFFIVVLGQWWATGSPECHQKACHHLISRLVEVWLVVL